MSLSAGYPWTHKNLRLLGYSMAGITTSIAFPDADACFDVGQGLPFQVPVTNLLITHGHLDHAAGLPYLIGQKAMAGQPAPNIYLPPSLATPMEQLMRIWAKIEDHDYQYRFIPVQEGVEYPLNGPYHFRIFPTFHRVPSNGYTIFERRKKLKDEYIGLPREELIDLKRKGHELEAHHDDPVISFTGDTRIEFIDASPLVRRSRVLVTEVTFWDEKKSVENARHWGHLHFEELLPKLDSLKCEKIVLIHASARYTTRHLREIIEDRVPEHHKTRLEIFPRPI